MPIQPLRFRQIIYQLERFVQDGHEVAFWVLKYMPDREAAKRCSELFIEAAVLADEQLACE